MASISERVAAARDELTSAGIGPDEASLSARVLAEHVLGWDAARYFSSAHEPEPPAFASSFGPLVARRAAREPTAYIIGRQEFWDLSFDVSRAVLIPRPSTELIVEAVLELVGADRSRPIRAADVGTGSGCVAVALARELPRATIVATDISRQALEVARRNADRHGVAGQVHLVLANLLDGVSGPFDLIAANPPYVREPDRLGLQPEVRKEPDEALFGGANGLALITALVQQSVPRLAPGGHLVFEFGYGQDLEVEALIHGTPELALVQFRHDLQGIARTAVARR